MKNICIVPVVAVTAILVGACASGNNGGESAEPVTATTSKPVIGVTVKPAPDQPSNGRSPVKFDPCIEFGDAAITKAGFDPATRKRSDQVHDGYAFISCAFDRKQTILGDSLRVGSLTISSTNVTLDEFRKREGSTATEMKVNSREAITYESPEAEACYVVMTGPDATIDVRVDSTAALTDWRACGHVQEIAGVVESALPPSK
jgi:hypothetical protein